MIKIAIMGYGTVGSGLIEIIDKNREKNNKLNNHIEITSILVRNKEKYKNCSHNEVITTNVEEFFNKESEIIVEVIGGVNEAYDYVKRALNLKKHVVTANKDLIATYGTELFNLANQNEVTLKFEAAVGGGIPIIKPLTEALSGNNITEIKAILNGTTNFILTKMINENITYEEGLKKAQELGFAEANPESDVKGYDAARKLAILSTLAFNKKVKWEIINTLGIAEIDKKDIEYAKKYNCKIKLVAEAFKGKNNIYASVKPMLIDEGNFLYRIDNEVNAVILEGDEIGQLLFSGKGAGKLPTGNAVYGDLNDIINKRLVKITAFNEDEAEINKFSQKTCNSILRIKTTNKNEVEGKCREVFNNIKFIDKTLKDEVVAYIECTSEAYIQKLIETISKEDYYISSKKLIFA